MEEIGTAANHDARIGRVEAKIDSMEKNISRVVDAVDRLTGVVHRPNNVQWGWVISGISVIIGTAFAFTTLVTLPIKDNNARQEERLNSLETQQHEDGERTIKNETTLSSHQAYDAEIHRLMMQEVRDIDLYGSRKWVKKEQEDTGE